MTRAAAIPANMTAAAPFSTAEYSEKSRTPRVKSVNAATGLPRGRCTNNANKAIGNPTITTANTVIGMPRIDTPNADKDVMKIVSPVENARISAAESRIVEPTIRASVQYPTANNAASAKTARYGFGGTIATRARSGRPVRTKRYGKTAT